MMWAQTIKISLFKNELVMQNDHMVSLPDRMHKLRLLFCHEVQLLVDLRFCFVLFCH